MKNIFKLGMNITLLLMFLSMLALPAGFMGLMGYEETPVVLSAQDSREEAPIIRAADDPEANVPEDVRDMILRMEREYYQQQQQDTFTEDIERNAELEDQIIQEETQLPEN